MKVPAIARLIKLVKNAPLTEQVTALRICPECHSRTLVETVANDEGHWMQCRRCRKVFVVNVLQGND